MSKGWQTKTLGEVCDFQRGLTYSKADEVSFSRNIVLRAMNIDLTSHRLNLTDLRYINDDVVVADSKKVKKGALLICTASGSKSHLGKIAFVDDDYDYAFGGFMGMLTPRSALAPRYLYHLLTSEAYAKFIGALADGMNINNLKFDELKQFPVPFPSLSEQQRIVGILDEALARIATATANTEKNLQNIRELFESHLHSAFDRSGPGWDCHLPLDELTEPGSPITYGVVKPGREGDVIFVRGGDLERGRILVDQLRTISSAVSKPYGRTLLRGGELLISLVGRPGEVAVVPSALAGANIARQVGLIRLSSTMNAEFVRFFLQSALGRRALGERQSGSVQQVINLGELRQVRIPTPSKDVQADVVASLEAFSLALRRLESAYEKKIAALSALKSALLARAFTGQLHTGVS